MAGERTKALGGWGCLPVERTKVFCNSGDGVCTGAFSISAAHLSYTSNGDIGKGAAFAMEMINADVIKGVEGECKYGLSAASLGGAKGTGAAPKGSGMPKGSSGAPKGKGTGGSKGSGELSPPPPAAEPAPAAGVSMGDMPGMSRML